VLSPSLSGRLGGIKKLASANVPINVAGTLQSPAIDWQQTLVQTMIQNAAGNLGDIFSALGNNPKAHKKLKIPDGLLKKP